MKTRSDIDQECGITSPNPERSPDQEVLEEQAEIFSCGGVFLGNSQMPPPKGKGTDFVFLPNRQKETLVYQGGKMVRRTGSERQASASGIQDRSSPQDVLRRFFKESLN